MGYICMVKKESMIRLELVYEEKCQSWTRGIFIILQIKGIAGGYEEGFEFWDLRKEG